METYILGGVQMGYHALLVLSGGTRIEDLQHYAYVPDKVVSSIADLDADPLATEFSAMRLAGVAPEPVIAA